MLELLETNYQVKVEFSLSEFYFHFHFMIFFIILHFDSINYSGLSKGIAIVRFKSFEDANSCLELHQIIEINDSPVWFEFGFEHSNADWICKSCQSINFQHRLVCFKCSSQKLIVKKFTNDGREDISNQATRFILIRGFEDTLNSKLVN